MALFRKREGYVHRRHESIGSEFWWTALGMVSLWLLLLTIGAIGIRAC